MPERPTGFGAYLEKYESVPSTMPIAHALAERPDVPSGAAVWANEQTAGKGRGGRRWESPPGRSLMVSFMLRRAAHAIALNRLVIVAAVATVTACRSVGIARERIVCKWPNDILYIDDAGALHKLAGILLETTLAGDDWTYAVLGIGINVNQAPEELPPVMAAMLPPISLRLALAAQIDADGEELSGIEVNRNHLFEALCEGLDSAAVLSSAAILAAWRDILWLPEGDVRLSNHGIVVAEGQMLGTDEAGNLLLRGADGVVTAHAAGDLSFRA